jgi:hypothetical protein
MGAVGPDRTRSLTGERARPRVAWRRGSCSPAMWAAPCACSIGRDGVATTGNASVVVISRWRAVESRSQPMPVSTGNSVRSDTRIGQVTLAQPI